MAAKDIIGKGKQFSSTYQPARKGGRKPNILKKLKAVGLSHDDIRAILENLIMADKKKAQELLADPELPLMVCDDEGHTEGAQHHARGHHGQA